MDLLQLFRGLPRPSQAGSISAEPTSERLFRVGRSHENHPVVLVNFASGSGTSAPRRLANIAYTPPSAVEITSPEGTRRTELMAMLECRATDPTLSAYFFRLVEILFSDPQIARELEFERALDAIITLFRALQRPGTRSVQGLWAELALIAWARDAEVAILAWHSSPRALHDFSAGNARLEVKSTTRKLREHDFRLDQLSQMTQGCTLIASFLLEELDDGASINDLLAVIGRRVHRRDLLYRVESIVAESLGIDWQEANTLRFDVASARKSFRLYNASEVPTPPEPIPPQIKDVRFVVDLSATNAVDLVRARGMSSFFRDALPDGKAVTE